MACCKAACRRGTVDRAPERAEPHRWSIRQQRIGAEAGHEQATATVGLDVHKESTEIALADARVGGELRHCGCVGGEFASLERAKHA